VKNLGYFFYNDYSFFMMQKIRGLAMNDNNLASDKFSYKAAWQGAKQLCSGVRAEIICIVFLLSICAAMVLFVLQLFFPQNGFSPLSLTISVDSLVKILLHLSLMAYFMLYIVRLFLSRQKTRINKPDYKITLKDVVVVTLLNVCAYVISLGVLTITEHISHFIFQAVPIAHVAIAVAYFIVASITLILGFVIAVTLNSCAYLVVIRRVDTGKSWMNAFRFFIKRSLRYTWRLFIFYLLVAVIVMLLGLVVFAIKFVGSILLHDILLSGGVAAHLISILAFIVGISVFLFLMLRYYPIIAALPCSIYLCSYTADGVQVVPDDVEKDASKLEK
jgi:hypothetical protein